MKSLTIFYSLCKPIFGSLGRAKRLGGSTACGEGGELPENSGSVGF